MKTFYKIIIYIISFIIITFLCKLLSTIDGSNTQGCILNILGCLGVAILGYTIWDVVDTNL